eukprot:2841982-Rhodomonas_salina.1
MPSEADSLFIHSTSNLHWHWSSGPGPSPWQLERRLRPGCPASGPRPAFHQQTDPPPRSRTFMNDQPG